MMQNKFSLAIELRYANGCNLQGLSREGIGVFLGNLIREALQEGRNIHIYLIINISNIDAAQAFLSEYTNKDTVELIYDKDETPILSSRLRKANLYYDSQAQFIYKTYDKTSQKVFDLKLQHWHGALIQNKCMAIHLETIVNGDPVLDSEDSIRVFRISIVKKENNTELIILDSQDVAINPGEGEELKASFIIDASCISNATCLELHLICNNRIDSITTISGLRIDLTCANLKQDFCLEDEHHLDVETRINNSTISSILFHHINTYHARYLRPCIYHMHDLVFLEHGFKYAKEMCSSENIQEFILQSREASGRIKDGSLVIFSSEHVRDRHFMKYSPHKFQSTKSVVIRNTFITSSFEESKQNISEEIQEICDNLRPYITYPTQPRPTKQLELLEEIVVRLREDNPTLKLVLTCSKEAYQNCHSRIPPDYIVFLAGVSRNDLYHVYNRASLCIVTTCYEASLPWQFLESLVAGTLSICYRSDIVDEFIRLGYLDQRLAEKAFFSTAEEAVRKASDLINFESRETSLFCSSKEYLASLQESLPSKSWNDITEHYLGAIKEFIRFGHHDRTPFR